MVAVAEMHACHWLLRDRHKACVLRDWYEPKPAVVYLQADFKQHVTLPVGPQEIGDWCYANARPP